MLGWAIDGWLTIVDGVRCECGWDPSLLFHFMPDEHTLVFQVRKSPLVFVITEQERHGQRFGVSYTGYEPGAEPDATMRRFGAGPARPAASVSEELEAWLRLSVARYAAEKTLTD